MPKRPSIPCSPPQPSPGSSPLQTPAPESAIDATMPRSSIVTEDVWAKAIHAVKVQKMSLRQAAQLYGVHHMSLHRRVRGRYASSVNTSFDVRSFLSADDEAEVLGVLREQFLYEKRITSDDIRFVVRAIASHGGKRAVPPEFPPSRWIVDFKRVHGFSKLNSYAYPPLVSAASSSAASEDAEMDDNDSEGGASYPRYAVPSYHHPQQLQQQTQQQQQKQVQQQQLRNRNDDRNDTNSQNQWEATSDGGRDGGDFGSNASSGSYETGHTTGGSSSCGSFENGGQDNEPARTYKLSHTVPPETWEKAIAAVEQQGMSLRAAARAYGVHFAALHRRVKKRAQGDPSAATMEGYFHPDDEAGIIRVVVARAELGVLMAFDELMDLVQRAALRNLPDISVDAARKLMARFQSRNEHSIRHIIVDWPLPRISAISLNNSKTSGSAIARQVRVPPRPSVIVDAGSASLMNAHTLAVMAAAAPAAPLIPSMGVSGSLLLPSQALMRRVQPPSQQQSPFGLQAPLSFHGKRPPASGDKHPIMFV